MLSPVIKPPPLSVQNYAAFANQLDINQLASKSDFFTLKSGKNTVTAIDAAFNGAAGGATSTQVSPSGKVQLFNAGTGSGQGTVSYSQGNQKFFQTGGADTTTQTSVTEKGGTAHLTVTQGSKVTTKTLANTIETLTPGEWAVIGGVVAGGFLLWYLIK